MLNNDIIKNIFHSKINGSFLIKIKNQVIKKLGPELLKIFPFSLNESQLVTGVNWTPEYDICRMIIGVHRHHSIFLTKEEIRNNQRDPEYQNQVINEVLEKVRLHQHANAFFHKSQIICGDEFLYFPVPYELFALCNRFFGVFAQSTVHPYSYFPVIMRSAISILLLLENNLLNDAYPLCRGMIELYIRSLIMIKHPKALESYEQFRQFEIEQSCCSQKYPDAFLELYERRKLPSAKSKVNYLHYGWLDNIDAYNITTQGRYSLYGIIEHLQSLSDNEMVESLDTLEFFYKECHGFVHGSVVCATYPLLPYFEINEMLYHVVRNVFVQFHRDIQKEISPEDKELLQCLDRDFEKLHMQYGKRTTDNFELYYEVWK